MAVYQLYTVIFAFVLPNFKCIKALIHLKFGGFGENLVVFKCIRPLIQRIMTNFNCIKAHFDTNQPVFGRFDGDFRDSSLETPDLREQSVVSDQITRLRSMQPFQQNIFLLMKGLLGLGSA